VIKVTTGERHIGNVRTGWLVEANDLHVLVAYELTPEERAWSRPPPELEWHFMFDVHPIFDNGAPVEGSK